MIISVFKDYKLFDIGDSYNVQELCGKLDLFDNTVVLDISKCITDYPATSILIDKILFALRKKKGAKTFTLITHLNVNELLLLHWLLIGSDFFKMDELLKSKPLKEIKHAMGVLLKADEISFSIQINSKKPAIVHEYKAS